MASLPSFIGSTGPVNRADTVLGSSSKEASTYVSASSAFILAKAESLIQRMYFYNDSIYIMIIGVGGAKPASRLKFRSPPLL